MEQTKISSSSPSSIQQSSLDEGRFHRLRNVYEIRSKMESQSVKEYREQQPSSIDSFSRQFDHHDDSSVAKSLSTEIPSRAPLDSTTRIETSMTYVQSEFYPDSSQDATTATTTQASMIDLPKHQVSRTGKQFRRPLSLIAGLPIYLLEML
jgi:hypothetical protein